MFEFWWFWVILRVVIGFGAMTIVLKLLTQKIESRTRAMAWQNGLSFLFWSAVCVTTMPAPWHANSSMAIIAVLGFFGSFASYCHWRAFKLSVSKTALLGQGDDLIAVAIAFLLLGETAYLRPLLICGGVLSIGAGLAFLYLRRVEDKTPMWAILKWIMLAAIVWGVTLPCTRFFAHEGMHLVNYAISWCAGAFAGCLLMRVSFGRKEAGEPLTGVQIRLVAFAAFLSIISVTSHFLSKRYAPLIVVQPIYQVAEIIPQIIGLWYFGEGKNLRPREIAMLCLAVVGIVLIMFSH